MINTIYGQTLGLPLVAVIGIGIVAAILAVVVIVLKGMALWTSARRNEKWWFIAILILNTVGILELIYLIFIAKRWSKQPVVSTDTTTTPPNPQV